MVTRLRLQRCMTVCISVYLVSCVILSLSQAHLIWLQWADEVKGDIIYISANVISPLNGAVYETGPDGIADVSVKAENISWVEVTIPYQDMREFVIHSYADHLHDDWYLLIFQPGETGKKWCIVASRDTIPHMVGAYGCRALTEIYDATWGWPYPAKPRVEDVHIYAVIGEIKW